MGQTTPFIGIYIPAAGETNYSDSFAQGMINIDQHDHSGGPNKGVPISSTGLSNFSVTFEKLNSNVADTTTGIGTNNSAPYQNQLQILGILRSIYQLGIASASGFITMNSTTGAARIFQNSSSITWTNPDGVSGNPSAEVNFAGISPVTVPNGGTGLTALAAWNVMCGGITDTDNIQQVSGQGTLGQVLVSQDSAKLPVWSFNFTQPTKPAFAAYTNTTSSASTGNGAPYYFPFQAVQFDQGSNFTTGASGGFTAPANGVYCFILNLIMQYSSTVKGLQIDFYVNGSSSPQRVPLYINCKNTSDNTGTLNIPCQQILQLNSGDFVYPVFTCYGASADNAAVVLANTVFSGAQIC